MTAAIFNKIFQRIIISFIPPIVLLFNFGFYLLKYLPGAWIRIPVIYHYGNGVFRNITLPYYLGIGLSDYERGIYYCKIFRLYRSEHFLCEGFLSQLDLILYKLQTPAEKYVKRKDFILKYGDAVIDIDLNTMDSYLNNQYYLKIAGNFPMVLNLQLILRSLQIKCDRVQFIELSPFQIKTMPIENVPVDECYTLLKN